MRHRPRAGTFCSVGHYDELIFETRSGDLVATKKNDLMAGSRDDPMEVADLKIKGQLLKALSVEDIVSVHRSGQRDLLVTLPRGVPPRTWTWRRLTRSSASGRRLLRGDVRDEGQAHSRRGSSGRRWASTRTP